MSASHRRTALFDPDHTLFARNSGRQGGGLVARMGQAHGWRMLDLLAEPSAPPTLSPA